jgi:hypothetical protein
VRFLATAALLLTLAGCAKNIQTKEAVKEAIMSYLAARQDKTGIVMSAMNVEVLNMNFQSDKAQATVAFNLKTGEGGMQLGYDLEREGNKWVVKGVSSLGGHEGTPAPAQALPPGHPGGAAPQGDGGLPAGHPPVETK